VRAVKYEQEETEVTERRDEQKEAKVAKKDTGRRVVWHM
jgi:hypothetical protein